MSDVRPDRVSLRLSGGYNLWPIEKWCELPLPERTKLILENRVKFLRGANIVPLREALTLLKKTPTS